MLSAGVALGQQLLRILEPLGLFLGQDDRVSGLPGIGQPVRQSPPNESAVSTRHSSPRVSQNQKAAATSAATFRILGLTQTRRASYSRRRRMTAGLPNAPMTVPGLVREWPNLAQAQEPASVLPLLPQAWVPPQAWVLPQAWAPLSFSQGPSWRWPFWRIFLALPPSPSWQISWQISSQTFSRTSWLSSPTSWQTSSKIFWRIFSSPSQAFCSF